MQPSEHTTKRNQVSHLCLVKFYNAVQTTQTHVEKKFLVLVASNNYLSSDLKVPQCITHPITDPSETPTFKKAEIE
jgi:hypothetical protein